VGKLKSNLQEKSLQSLITKSRHSSTKDNNCWPPCSHPSSAQQKLGEDKRPVGQVEERSESSLGTRVRTHAAILCVLVSASCMHALVPVQFQEQLAV
jgi:hypothetical protein